MAKKASTKKTGSKAKRTRRVRSTTRSSIIPVWSEGREGSNKNTTKHNPEAGNPDSLVAHVKEFFGTVAKRFEANKGYGRQHINSNGVVHPDAALTKSNRACTKTAIQFIEVLAQRAALAGNKEAEAIFEGSLATPAEAKKFLADIAKFARERANQIKADESQAILDDIAKDIGLEDGSSLVPASKAKAKPKAKAG
tara:strand:- start:26104 stop:26691 length:588 start_codon:yes stop_codon:yes gene_type:complete